MHRRTAFSLRWPATLAIVLGFAAAVAPGAERSPFMPPGSGAAAPAAAASPLDKFEFRGVMTIGADTFVTLFDTSTSKSVTVTVGEAQEGIKVVDYRSDAGSVRVESGGMQKTLTLREAKIVAMAVPPPTPPPQPGVPPGIQPPQPGGAPAVAGAPMSDEEARARMQRVAEEIRRRREMRRQMLEGQQGRPANQ